MILLSDEPRSDAAILASLSMEESRGLVTLRPAQEHREGILPAESNQENRNVRVESCCFVDGHIFGKDVDGQREGRFSKPHKGHQQVHKRTYGN